MTKPFPHPSTLLPPYHYNTAGIQRGIDLLNAVNSITGSYSPYVTVDTDGTVKTWPEWGCRPQLHISGMVGSWHHPWYARGLAADPTEVRFSDQQRAWIAPIIDRAKSQLGIVIGVNKTLFCEIPKPWVAFDLDNTLVKQAPQFNPVTFGDIIPEGRQMLSRIIGEGEFGVRILTARLDPCTPGAAASFEAIVEWTIRNFGSVVWPTPIKDSHMVLLYDDRCWRVE